jgi:hypothetical protein
MVFWPRTSSTSGTKKLRFETAASMPFTVTVTCSTFTVPETMSFTIPATGTCVTDTTLPSAGA